jgi:hypothetical protein
MARPMATRWRWPPESALGCGGADLLVHLLVGDLLEAQREGHVLVHRHVGVQGVALEDHGDVAVLGRHVVHAPAVDQEVARGDVLEAGDHAQRGGLAAARRTDEDDELLVVDREVEVLHRHDALVGDLEVGLVLGRPLPADAVPCATLVRIHLAQALELHLGHCWFLLVSRRHRRRSGFACVRPARPPGRAPPYPLTAPATTPSMMYFWQSR